MPKVNGKKYPYTKAGMAAARDAKKKKKVTKKAGNARRRSMGVRSRQEAECENHQASALRPAEGDQTSKEGTPWLRKTPAITRSNLDTRSGHQLTPLALW